MEKQIAWTVACVGEFARRFGISIKASFQYLFQYGGIAFLEEHYEAEHLLSFDDAIDDLVLVCQTEGGSFL